MWWAWSLASLTLVAVALSPASLWLQRWAESLTGPLPAPVAPVAALAIFTGVVVLLFELAALPALIYKAVCVDGAYGLASTSAVGALAAELPAAALALPLAAFVAALVRLSAVASAQWWWLCAGLGLSTGLVAAIGAGPLLLARLGAVRPLARTGLAAALAPVIAAARVPVFGVYEWGVGRRAHASALVAGVGRGRRVLVSSDLVRTWSDEEIAVVVAHELAHHAHHDVWRAVALNASIVCVGLWAADRVLLVMDRATGLGAAGDLSALPLIAVVCGGVWLVSTPLRHAQSRRHELRADRFALACTGAADAFGAAVRRLSAERLSEERPSTMTRWLFHRHPPVAERLGVAEAYRRRVGNP